MSKFKKGLNTKIIALTLSIGFFCNTTLYSYPVSEYTLRVQVGTEDTQQRVAEVMRLMQARDAAHQKKIDIVIATSKRHGIGDIEVLEKALTRTMEASGAKDILDGLTIALAANKVGESRGQIQIVFVDELLAEFEGERVEAHPGSMSITLFIETGDPALTERYQKNPREYFEDKSPGRDGKTKGQNRVEEIVAKTCRETMLRSTRAREMFVAMEIKGELSDGEIRDVLIQLEKDADAIRDEVEAHGKIRDGHPLHDVFANLKFDQKVDPRLRGFTLGNDVSLAHDIELKGRSTQKPECHKGFFVPNDSHSRTVDLEIFEPGQDFKTIPYTTYYGRFYSDVGEFLDAEGIGHDKVSEIIHGNRHSVVIGIPVYGDGGKLEAKIDSFKRVLHELRQLKDPNSPFKDWPVRLVINVNGLDQEVLLRGILEFQRDYSTPLVPVTVIHMPLGGLVPTEKTPGKKDVMNAIVDYSKGIDATIIGFVDSDTVLSEGGIFSNVNFLISKARELNSPLLTGPKPVAIPANTLCARIVSRQSRNKIRGNCRFTFLFSMPPIFSLPMSEDVYLRLYFADAEAGGGDPYWRILADPDSQSFYSYAPTFLKYIKQAYRWELMDRWTYSLLSEEKENIEKRRYGLPVFVKYFKSLCSDSESTSLSLKFHKLRKTFVYFILKDVIIGHLVALELWLRQKLDKPRFSITNKWRVVKATQDIVHGSEQVAREEESDRLTTPDTVGALEENADRTILTHTREEEIVQILDQEPDDSTTATKTIGSPLKCLETFREQFKDEKEVRIGKAVDEEKEIEASGLIAERKKLDGSTYSRSTVYEELKWLIEMGLVKRTRPGHYALTEWVRELSDEQMRDIYRIKELQRFSVQKKEIEPTRKKVCRIYRKYHKVQNLSRLKKNTVVFFLGQEVDKNEPCFKQALKELGNDKIPVVLVEGDTERERLLMKIYVDYGIDTDRFRIMTFKEAGIEPGKVDSYKLKISEIVDLHCIPLTPAKLKLYPELQEAQKRV